MIEKMFIDIGAKDRKEANQFVNIGDVACYESEFEDLGSKLMGKAFDDRVGCAVLIQVLKSLSDSRNSIYIVFTVQEEVGLRGAHTATYSIDPDVSLAVDVTPAFDTPKLESEVCLGKGPAIKMMDNVPMMGHGIITNSTTRKIIVDAAKEADIPYQLEVLERGSTDASAIHLTREGVLTGVISIPTRHTHTPSEIIDFCDVENTVELLLRVLGKIG